jgi:hypothetical protein
MVPFSAKLNTPIVLFSFLCTLLAKSRILSHYVFALSFVFCLPLTRPSLCSFPAIYTPPFLVFAYLFTPLLSRLLPAAYSHKSFISTRYLRTTFLAPAGADGRVYQSGICLVGPSDK